MWHPTEAGRRALIEAGAPERRRAATGEAALRNGLAARAHRDGDRDRVRPARVGVDHGLGGGGGALRRELARRDYATAGEDIHAYYAEGGKQGKPKP
ncbi:hypothetical protein, partial [Embleya sp. NPDC055610]